ncbi:MAG: GTPase HflX [Cyclobacteriaceae bacterium]|nr:GTPase HflX [Cyclobacteriaceae bacterium]
MGKLFETANVKERGILVAVTAKQQSDDIIKEHLDELEFLAKTMDIITEKTFVQKLEHPDRKTYVGKGKLEEIQAYVEMEKIDLIIFDDDLSPSQLRNLENELKVKIYDRSLIILDIFLKRAKTAQAKTQVELARFQYLLPRLTRMWTHLERQRGGTGTRGGAGEKEIETDRRAIRNRISLLRKQLDKIELQAATRRKAREGIVRVAFVGYTNAGKSTLMKLLSKEDVYAKDELFATVDSTVRKVVLNEIPFLLSDTVGFIRKLPHNLIESFKSTLEEVKEADLLLHVIDVSNPAHEDHIQVVESTLKEIQADHIPTLRIYNKSDKLEHEELEGLNSSESPDSLFVSAITQYGVEQMKERIYKEVLDVHIRIYPNYLKPQYF